MGSPTWQEDHVEADGVRIRYVHAGEGPALVHLHDAGTPTPAHGLLARERRVIALQMPHTAGTTLRAVSGLGIDRYDLMGTSFGATIALVAALTAPERVRALVLESPTGDPELEAALSGLQVPVLVVIGTEAGPVAAETGRTLKELLPNCQLLYVYDAGAAVAADRPEAFAEAVSDFLERHEQYVVSRRSSVLFP
jgi:pimeloyl-ACP methyl ester carboxylesterase